MNLNFSYLTHLLFPKLCFGCTREGSHLCPDCSRHLLTLRWLEGVCVFCHAATSGYMCSACGQHLRLDNLVVGAQFSLPIMTALIHAWKFRGLRDITEPLAQLISQALLVRPPHHFKQLVIIPLPMHWLRRRQRGYNQTDLLAAALATQLNLSLNTTALKRHWSPQQSKMRSVNERLENVANTFYCPNPETINHRHILLIDDISTSGQTLSQAAKTLRTAGAASVTAAVVAKG